MRTALSFLCLVFMLSVMAPAQAQLRETAQQSRSVQTQLYDTGSAAVNALGDLFGAEHFRMSHSYEASFSSFGGETSSMGTYTSSMMWQFNSNWAARADVSVAHPFTGGNAYGSQEPRVYLRNAEVAYRPSENMEFRLQVQQSPYGRYMSPYGYHSRSSAFTPRSNLFWQN